MAAESVEREAKGAGCCIAAINKGPGRRGRGWRGLLSATPKRLTLPAVNPKLPTNEQLQGATRLYHASPANYRPLF